MFLLTTPIARETKLTPESGSLFRSMQYALPDPAYGMYVVIRYLGATQFLQDNLRFQFPWSAIKTSGWHHAAPGNENLKQERCRALLTEPRVIQAHHHSLTPGRMIVAAEPVS